MARQLRRLFLTSLLAPLMLGCTSTAPSTDTFCQNAYDIGLATDEHLDDMNARKIKAQDLYGIEHCGW